MATIMYWNIQNFAFNKIANPAAPLDALRRLLKILSNLAVNIPDIFVVVEVSTGGGPIGSPVTGAGANGSMELLAWIRAAIPGNWFLVPPLISGTGGFAEGVAVYYNANTLAFTGPNVLRATGGGALVSVTPPIPGGGAAAAYGAPWVGYAPAAGGGAINALPMGNNFAGKARFTATPPAGAGAGVTGRPLTFPNLNNRSPYLTTFTDLGGRTIKVIAFHSSPALAMVGSAFMLGMDEMITTPVGNEVQVMVGDFNVPLGSPLAPAVYPPFALVGFTQHFALGGAAPPAQLATHMLPWAASSPVGAYPIYGYMNAWESIDNVFTRYGAPPGAAIANAALAGSAGVVGAIPAVAGGVAAIAGGVGMGGTTANTAIMAAQGAAATAPAAAATVITQLSLIPALAALTVPAAVVQAAADAIDDLGGAVPGGVTAALLAGGPIALPVAAAAATTAAFERAGAEVADIANAVQASINAAALGGTAIAAGTAAAAAATAAAAAAVAANAAAAAALAGIGAGPNTTAANAVPLIRAAAGSGVVGLIAAVPEAGAVAALGVGGPAALGAFPMNAMIVNQVTGAPYGPAGPALFPVYPSRLANPGLLGLAGIGNLAAFRGWNNYRAVRSTSDHFALVIDV